jgi:cell division protease FtsH
MSNPADNRRFGYGRKLALWIIIALLLIALFQLFRTATTHGPSSTLAFSDLLDDVGRGQVADVTLPGQSIAGHFKDGRAFTSYAPTDSGLFDRLQRSGAQVTVKPADELRLPLVNLIVSWFPLALLIGVWIFFMRQMGLRRGREP